VDELLGALHEEGALDSSGRFTVARQARDKLRRFQLLEPQRCVLQFVAAALAGNAPAIDVRGTDDELELRYDGFAPNATELRSLLDYLFHGDSAPAIHRELAVGVNTALELTRKVTIESWEGSSGYKIEFRTAGDELETPGFVLTHCPWGKKASGCRIKLHFKEEASLMDSLAGRTAGKRSVEFLARHCSHAPIPLREGRDLRPALIFRPALAILRLSVPGVRLAGYQSDSQAFALEREARGACAALLSVRPDRGGGVRWVHRGITLRLDHKTFDGRVEGVIYCDHLRKNISFTDLVEDEAFTAAVEELQELIRELLWEIVSEERHRPEAAGIASLVRSHVSSYPRERWPVLNAWLLARARRADQSPLLGYRERLAYAQDAADAFQQDRIRRQVLQDIAAQAFQCWCRGELMPRDEMRLVLAVQAHLRVASPELHQVFLLAALAEMPDLEVELEPFVDSPLVRGLARVLGRDLAGGLAELGQPPEDLEAFDKARYHYARGLSCLHAAGVAEAHASFQQAEKAARTEGETARALEGQFLTLSARSKAARRLELQRKIVRSRARTAGDALVYYHLEERRLAWEAHDYGTWASHDVERFRAGWDPNLQFYLRDAEGADPGLLERYIRAAEQQLTPTSPWLSVHLDIGARQLAARACWPALADALLRQMARQELLSRSLR